jgi:RNA polymerase sigma factor (sigma-70 family)
LSGFGFGACYQGKDAMTEDTELLRRYAEERSEGAFAELVRRRVDLVYSVARRQCGGDAHLAEEVTQRVFADLAKKAKTLAGRSVISGWLYRSAQFAASDAVRSERRRRAREQEDFLMKDTTTELNGGHRVEENAETERLRPLLDAALGALSEADRDAVALRFLEERPWAEVANTLGLKEDAARKRVARALDSLQGLLARRGITSTAVVLSGALGGQVGVAAPVGLATSVVAGALTAEVSSGGLGLAGILTSMSTLKTSVSIGVAVFAIGFGIYEAKERSRADAGAAEVRDESERLRLQLNAARRSAADSEQRAVKAEEQRAALERTTRRLFSNTTVSGGALPLSSSSGPSPEGQLSLSRTPPTTDPEQARQQTRNLNRPGVRLTYSPFYQKLGLTPEERNRFDELVLDNTERGSALFKKAAAQSPARDRESLQTIAEVINDQNHASLGTLVSDAFGDKIGGEFKRFQETMALRPVTNQLASGLFYTETPLSTVQAEQLVEIMAQHARTADGKVNPAEMDKSAVLAAARAVLSAPQIEALSGYIDETIRRGGAKR